MIRTVDLCFCALNITPSAQSATQSQFYSLGICRGASVLGGCLFQFLQCDTMFRAEGTPPVEVTKHVNPLLTIFTCVCVIWAPVTILEAFKGQVEHMQQWTLHDRCQLRERQFRCKIVSAVPYPLNASRVCLQFVPFNFFVVESTWAFHLVLYRKLWLFCIL